MSSSGKRAAFDRAGTDEYVNPSNMLNASSSLAAEGNVVLLKNLNPYITCPLCSGYFIDATTVIDCLHTFCKSCLLKYFEDNNDCPKCHYQIHQSHPSHYVAFDRTMQDIVYKLVPGMQMEEQRRRDQFRQRQRTKEAKQNGQLNGATASLKLSRDRDRSDSPLNHSAIPSPTEDHLANQQHSADGENNNTNEVSPSENNCCCTADQDPTTTHRRGDQQVFIRLVPDEKLDSIERSFVRLSALATVNTVKRLLAYLLLGDITKYSEFDIFCNYELMGRDFSMDFIRKTRWRNKPEPVILNYKERLDF